MLALVSMSSASAIGRFVWLKNVTSCLTPSSKILKSSAVRSVTYRAVPSVTVTLSETRSTPARKGVCGCDVEAGGRAGGCDCPARAATNAGHNTKRRK
jgi:hypothetical protein